MSIIDQVKGTFSQIFVVPEDSSIGSPKVVISSDHNSNDEDITPNDSRFLEEDKEPPKNETRNSINKLISMPMQNKKIFKGVTPFSPSVVSI